MLWDYVNINCGAVLQMSRIVLPGMISRSRGAIINISSSSSQGPCPLMSVYSATKSFEDHFGLAVGYEVKDKGVTIQTINPCQVKTRMVEQIFHEHPANLMIPEPAKFARHALSTLGFAEQTTGYWPHGILSIVIGSLVRLGLFRKVMMSDLLKTRNSS